MAPILKSLLALAAVLPFALGASAASSGDDSQILGKYIVVFKEDSNLTSIASHFEKARSLTKRDGDPVVIEDEYELGAFKGYSVTADEAAIEAIAATEEVDYVEADQWMYASAVVSQASPPWGLGRISRRARGATAYRYDDTAGAGTWVYVLDTGIRTTHSQFGGRAVAGTSFISGQTTDGHGHGTHCAGTVGGSTYGVAKRANLVGVKVLGNDGRGPNTGVISGIQWATNNAVTNGRAARSVISLSLGGVVSAATNAAARAAYNAGLTVVVAAGNENQLASNRSPASESTAITVAASDTNDARSIWPDGFASNYGAAVDIFAPGTAILSAGIASDTAAVSNSGTSMAAPHVAGLAAYLINLESITTPAAVWSRINALATTGVITDLVGSPNKLIFNGVPA